MSMCNGIAEELITEFISNYMEKLFYFCLKKTGNVIEAEDLASDISLNIISQLQKGTVPTSYSAWVWRIARNRYSAWADRKHKRNEYISGADISEIEAADERSIEEAFVRSEDLKLLRRELAFISSDYREIIVAYYIDNRSVKDIAKSLDLPEGTVKSKLFRSRNILKEGMCMARKFGVMSYKPENVGFIMNGISGRSGEPWSLVKRNLYKNIILAAYRTPSTAEELSIELGVALPYMEDELQQLSEATLLKKNGSKYETNIFIVSAQAQERIYKNLLVIAPEFTSAIIALKEFQIICLDKNGSQWHEGYQPFEDMKWALLMNVVDEVNFSVIEEVSKNKQELLAENQGRWGRTKRPNGGEWDLLGLEEYNGYRPAFVGLHGCMDTPYYEELIDFGQFKFMYKGINTKTFPSLHQSLEWKGEIV